MCEVFAADSGGNGELSPSCSKSLRKQHRGESEASSASRNSQEHGTGGGPNLDVDPESRQGPLVSVT